MTYQAINIEDIFNAEGELHSNINRGTIVTNGNSQGIFVGQHPKSGSVWIAWNMNMESFAIMSNRLDAITLKAAAKWREENEGAGEAFNPYSLNFCGELLNENSGSRAVDSDHYEGGKVALVGYYSGPKAEGRYGYWNIASRNSRDNEEMISDKKVTLYLPQGKDMKICLKGVMSRQGSSENNVSLMIEDQGSIDPKSNLEAFKGMFCNEILGYSTKEERIVVTAKIDLSENSIFAGKYRELV